MGVITHISLSQLKSIFPSYHFTKLTPTLTGIIDTTYIVHTIDKEYILKKYERNISQKIAQDITLLKDLNAVGLNVPLCLESNEGWYLYKKLEGSHPKNVKSFHIQALGRFLAKMHNEALKTKCDANKDVDKEIVDALTYTKSHFYSYYKRFEFLKDFIQNGDAVIHGDIFKDNTLFHNRKIGVIDFIDSFCGSFYFDVAVALIGFDVREKDDYTINIFLIAYNQHAPKKLSKTLLKKKMKTAACFYALKRINFYKNTSKARELLR